MQTTLDKFALGNLTVSRDRRYLPPTLGGLGLFKLETFLDAQRCSWIKRAQDLPIDNWRIDLKSKSPGFNILDVRSCDIDSTINPVLSTIVNCYEKLVFEHTTFKRNYKKSSIFLNPAFVRSEKDNLCLDIEFFTKTCYTRNKDKLRSLKFEDCFLNNKFRTPEEFEQINIFFSPIIWFKLQAAITYNKKKFASNDENENKSESLKDLFEKSKKGSKRYRTVLTYKSFEINHSVKNL